MHGPSTLSNLCLSSLTHVRVPFALTVAARGRFKTSAISPAKKQNHWYQVQPLKSLGIHPGDVSCLAFNSLENSINPFGNILPFSPLKYLRFSYQSFKSERPPLGSQGPKFI